MNYWFVSDEHYGHRNVIEYCNRPFYDVEEMDEALISNHNSVVKDDDLVIHAGDFTLWKNVEGIYKKYINRLKGKHIFLKGSHDYWLPWNKSQQIWEKKFPSCYIVVCHYAMHTWARSHYNSYHLFGHSHGNLELPGKRYDIGVDKNNFFPVSLKQITDIMKSKGDNPNKYNKRRNK